MPDTIAAVLDPRVFQLMAMGFPQELCEHALRQTSSSHAHTGIRQAVEFLLQHGADVREDEQAPDIIDHTPSQREHEQQEMRGARTEQTPSRRAGDAAAKRERDHRAMVETQTEASGGRQVTSAVSRPTSALHSSCVPRSGGDIATPRPQLEESQPKLKLQAELEPEPEPEGTYPSTVTSPMVQWSVTETALWVESMLGLPPDSPSSSKLRTEFQCDTVDGDYMSAITSKRLQNLFVKVLDTDPATATQKVLDAREALVERRAETAPLQPLQSAAVDHVFGSGRDVPEAVTPEHALGCSFPEDPSECKSRMHARVDEWCAGRWTLTAEIGRGGTGVVYQAEDRRLRKTVALKFALIAPEHQHKVFREAVLLQKCRHPHVCAIEDYYQFPGTGLVAMVLELMNLGSLAQRLSSERRLGQREVVNMAYELLQALRHVHELGIVHRDVKPANILRHRGPDGVVYKLGDFGIAVAEQKAEASPNTVQTNTVGLHADVGTPLYMSPEQLKKRVSVSAPTDLWALGVVMYEALTGCRPFGHDDADDYIAVSAAVLKDEPQDPRDRTEPGGIDDGVAELILKLLRKEVADRFDSAISVAKALEAAFASSSVDAFDVFINYRVSCEKDFAEELFTAIERHKIGLNRRRPRVYLDKVRLLDGERFDLGFTRGLAQSLVFAPLMSMNCMKSFATLGDDDLEDFVLVEYYMALALHSRGIIKAILPVILNEQEDGTHTQEFFQDIRSGVVDGRELPTVPSEKSFAKAASFLAQLPPQCGGPIALTTEDKRTVKDVVSELLTFQAVLLHVDRAWEAGDLSSPGLIRSSHGDLGERHATRAAVIEKLATRLIQTVEKHSATAALSVRGRCGTDEPMVHAEPERLAAGVVERQSSIADSELASVAEALRLRELDLAELGREELDRKESLRVATQLEEEARAASLEEAQRLANLLDRVELVRQATGSSDEEARLALTKSGSVEIAVELILAARNVFGLLEFGGSENTTMFQIRYRQRRGGSWSHWTRAVSESHAPDPSTLAKPFYLDRLKSQIARQNGDGVDVADIDVEILGVFGGGGAA